MKPRVQRIRAMFMAILGLCVLLGTLGGADITFAAGRAYYVSPNGSDSQNGLSAGAPLKTIQKAVDLAQPGDVINLAAGTYLQDILSKRNGTAQAPITITGPANAVVKGGGNARIIQIGHDYLTLNGFTIDGLYGSASSRDGYRDKLLYALGTETRAGVVGMRVLNMSFKNAGGECVRLRYFAQNNEIANSTFVRCGVHDFSFNAGGKNGEAIYIGTAPEQRGDGKNPTTDPDLSNNNWIHHNTFDTQGNECVDIKEAASGNIVEFNTCTGQRDPESAGFDSRGNGNVFRNNTSSGNIGAGFRLGGDTSSDGINNDVYNNTVQNNKAGGIKVQRTPQRLICGNSMSNNGGGDAVGTYASKIKPTTTCGTTVPTGTAAPTVTNTPVPTSTVPPTASPTKAPATTSTATATPTSAQVSATPTTAPTIVPTTAPTTAPTSPPSAQASCGRYLVDGRVATFVEAERANSVSGRFQELTDGSRSGGKAMVIPGSGMTQDAGTALTFNVDVVAGGTFQIWLLGYGKDGATDSFFARIDASAPVQANVTSGAWGWKKVSGTVALADGSHTLQISNREDGAQVDKILLTRDSGLVPTGLGGEALVPSCS